MTPHAAPAHIADEPHWPFLAISLLGLWLLFGPSTYAYGGPMAASDLVLGAVLLIAGIACISAKQRTWARWVVVIAGMWLLFAPLVFDTAHAVAYLNSTVLGALAIAFAIIVPRGLNGAQNAQPNTPPGWTFNPSSWLQRTPIILLALVNFLLARYLAAFQLGHTDAAWDPLFGDGTENVLTSNVSEAFPISDAGLGAAAYLLEALIGCIGNAGRWRTAPRAVALFGVLVVPVGVVSILLMMLQPLAVDTWCAICLLTAASMLIMAALALPEVAALCWFLWHRKREGKPFWHTFFHGGDVTGGTTATTGTSFTAPLREVLGTMYSGITLPWNLPVCVVAGAWVMASPTVLTLHDFAEDAHYIAGAIVITVAALATAEIARAMRFANIALGGLIIAAPWLPGEASTGATLNAAAVGIIVIVLSIPRGSLRQHHGTLQQFVR